MFVHFLDTKHYKVEIIEIMLRDNQIFKALLRIKKSFMSIHFNLAKHVLVSPPNHLCTGWVNFDLKAMVLNTDSWWWIKVSKVSRQFIGLSSVNSLVLHHNSVISSKRVNLSINYLARIQNRAWWKYCCLYLPFWYLSDELNKFSFDVSLENKQIIIEFWYISFLKHCYYIIHKCKAFLLQYSLKSEIPLNMYQYLYVCTISFIICFVWVWTKTLFKVYLQFSIVLRTTVFHILLITNLSIRIFVI